MLEIKTEADLKGFLQLSMDGPALLFKHSTRCSVSARAYEQYQAFVQDSRSGPGVNFALLRVIEERDLSNEAAKLLGVRHESPQLLLISEGRVLWHESHWRITKEAIASALKTQKV